MKLICSFTCVLFVTLFAGHKIDKTLIVTVRTMFNLKSFSSHCAAKYSSVSYIIANFTLSFATFSGTYFFCNRYKLARTKLLLSFNVLQNETISPREKVS